MNAIQQVLTDAKARISDPAKWGKGVPAGSKVPDGLLCAGNAITQAAIAGNVYGEHVFVPFRRVSADSVVNWNDAPERTHPEVMAAFDRAIELAGQS